MNVRQLCKLCRVSRSGYYNWIASAGKRAEKEKRDRSDFALVLEAYRFRGFDKGARGLHMRLLHMGILMNVKKIRRLMKKYGLRCPIRKANPYRRMLREMRTDVIAPNHVDRKFKSYGPQKVLLTDITYIPFNGSFVYLSVILDAYTMQVLSYVLSQSLEVDFVLQTVEGLVRFQSSFLECETYIHSDQGSHYTSVKFREIINDAGLRQSMSRRGNCWDNAPQESFFGHMKDETGLRKHSITTFEEIRTLVDEWMDYYNNDRYQMQLKMLSPNEYYRYITTGIDPLSQFRKN